MNVTNATSHRHVLVHYHLFKNAGTSIERLLRDSFGDAWSSWDREEPGARICGQDMQRWLEERPGIRAVSSHQVVPPVPRGNLSVTPIVFLREPLLRVKSAWLFEWQKQLGLETPKGSLVEYIESKFVHQNSSVIANFQASRLGNIHYDATRPRLHRYNEELLSAACEFVDSLPFVGLVERFSDSLELMQVACRPGFPDFIVKEHRENVLESSADSVEVRLEKLRVDIGNELFDELCVRNRLDLQLYAYARGRFGHQYESLRAGDVGQDASLSSAA